MSKNPIREDKTCLNCNYVVDQRFCPNCGQENTNTRKTFHHLFVHFFEDLTHYENAFWKTIRNLIFKPASLTKEYLSGKRLSYLAPVRLYIFISIVTFFLIAVIPTNKESDFVKIDTGDKKEAKKGFYNHEEEVEKERKIDSLKNDSIAKQTISKEELKIDELKKQGVLSSREADSIKKFIEIAKKNKNNDNSLNFGYDSVEKMDSIRKVNPDEINDLEYWLNKKTIPLNEKFTSEEIKEKFLESFIKNLPKALFIYMPLFALVLWLFHNKKRWYYFDHGIFTLHYFSFILLIFLIQHLFNGLINLIDNGSINIVSKIFTVISSIWMFYYFFPAHHRFYGETRFISFLKSATMFFINMLLIFIVLLCFSFYTFINLH
ncbi:DUF3667 domain-containing protein [Flavobacterium sp.]|uniref:DUF3667 domain-containing protein n=1 Tax=Flavobacterium sp. TaxID=239 RepID=UPI00286E4447|nr:DUF3667 domain-containing protein [Flavobacterium sp.]